MQTVISVVFHAALPCEIMIISFFGYCIFLRSTTINARPPKVSSLVDRMSTNVLSAISKTENIRKFKVHFVTFKTLFSKSVAHS